MEDAIARECGLMLAELESARLEVCLTDAPRPVFTGHMIRTCFDRNVAWYRKLCDEHPSGRVRRSTHSDTRIRRRDVTRLLEKLSNGTPTRSYIADALVKIAARRLEEADPF